jgi:hypothetical protein
MNRHIQPIFQSWEEREINLLLSWAVPFQKRYQARQKKQIIYKNTRAEEQKEEGKNVPNPPVSSARFLSPC